VLNPPVLSRPDDYDFTLGVWHPCALPADKWNRAGFETLDRGEWVAPSLPDDAVSVVQAFYDEVYELAAELAGEDWDLFFYSGALYHLISLSANLVPAIAPRIVASAGERGLVCYDPQSDTTTGPPTPSR
jgi:hypothetical protein